MNTYGIPETTTSPFAPNPMMEPGGTLFSETNREFDTKQSDWEQAFGLYKQQSQGMSGLLNAYNQAYAQAQQQNEAKYQQQLGLVNQVSGQQRADTIANFQKQKSDSMNQLARLGMSNTSGVGSQQAGIQRQEQGALNNLSDQLLGTKLGVMQNFNYQGMDPTVTSTAISAMRPQVPSTSISL